MDRKKLTAAIVMAVMPAVSWAATDGVQIVNTATSSLRSMLSGLLELVSVVISIICAIGLCVTIGKWIITEHDAKDALLKWGSGFILGVVLLGLLKATSM